MDRYMLVYVMKDRVQKNTRTKMKQTASNLGDIDTQIFLNCEPKVYEQRANNLKELLGFLGFTRDENVYGLGVAEYDGILVHFRDEDNQIAIEGLQPTSILENLIAESLSIIQPISVVGTNAETVDTSTYHRTTDQETGKPLDFEDILRPIIVEFLNMNDRDCYEKGVSAIKFKEGDIAKKLLSYRTPESLGEDYESFLHKLTGPLHEIPLFLAEFFDSGHRIYNRIIKEIQGFQKFHDEVFQSSNEKSIPYLYHSIRNLAGLVFVSLSRLEDKKEEARAISYDLSKITSSWNIFLGTEDNFNLQRKLDVYSLAMHEQLKKRGIQYQLRFPDSFETECDYFGTVIDNLVGNAVKYAFDQEDPNKTLTIEEERDDTNQCYVISVSDNGKGIEPSILDKIWDRGFSTSKGGDGHGLGRGLGLYEVKNIVEKNGGNIRVESELGKGAIFRFTIPYNICT